MISPFPIHQYISLSDEGRRDDGVAADPWSSQQQVVRCVGINEITRHCRLQILDLTSEFDLARRARTIGIEALNGSLCSAQSMGKNPYVLHNPVGHNAQSESWINLNATHFR